MFSIADTRFKIELKWNLILYQENAISHNFDEEKKFGLEEICLRENRLISFENL